MTSGLDHEPYFGHVEDIMTTEHPDGEWFKGEIMVVWERESGAGVTYENPAMLKLAPRKPVPMRRVGWMVELSDGTIIQPLFDSSEHAEQFVNRNAGETVIPIYVKKGGK